MMMTTERTTATPNRSPLIKLQLGTHAFDFQYPFKGAFWTLRSFSSRCSAVTTVSGRFRLLGQQSPRADRFQTENARDQYDPHVKRNSQNKICEGVHGGEFGR